MRRGQAVAVRGVGEDDRRESRVGALRDLRGQAFRQHAAVLDAHDRERAQQRSIVHQRELHSDTPSFALALRAALRQAPKVILVGEMRDKETIEIALEAAETVGDKLVRDIVEHWGQRKETIPSLNH